MEQTGDHERQWARLVRGQGRRGVHLDQWIDFHTIGDYGEWNSERSLDRLKQMYGQSFAALSYVAAAYGEAAFVPLLRAVIEEPDDLNVPFRRILGVSFDEFQAAVREFLLTPTPFEAEMAAVGVYARAVFEIADEDRELATSWDLFLRFRRPSLDPEASAAEIMEFSDAFVALHARVEALEPPERLADVHAVLEGAFPRSVEAMNAYARLETTLIPTCWPRPTPTWRKERSTWTPPKICLSERFPPSASAKTRCSRRIRPRPLGRTAVVSPGR